MMCAKLLEVHRKEGEKGTKFYIEVTEDYYNRVIAFLRPHREMGAETSNGNPVRDVRNPGSHAGSVRGCAQAGFFPVQDTGVILGISEAPDNISFDADVPAPAGTGEGDSQG